MAKIYYSLYDRMLYEKGLLQAFAKVKSNKRAPGIDGQTIADFAEHVSGEVALLADTPAQNFEGRIGRSRVRGPYARLCVQRRLACSAGDSPAGVKVRSPVA